MKEEIGKLLSAAWEERRKGSHAKAKKLVDAAMAHCLETDHDEMGRIHHVYMQIDYDHNRYLQAIDHAQDSMHHYRLAENRPGIAHATRHLADLHMHLGNLDHAEENYQTAIKILRDESGTSAGNLANALRGFAILMQRKGALQRALHLWREARSLYQSIGIAEGISEAEEQIRELSR